MVQNLFGYSRGELIGMPVENLLPEAVRNRHVGHRAAYALQPHARPMGLGLDLVASARTGPNFPSKSASPT